MDAHTVEVFLKRELFSLTSTSIAEHLWGCVTLSDFGITTELIPELARRLGIKQNDLTKRTSPQALSLRVAAESTFEITLVRSPFPFFL